MPLGHFVRTFLGNDGVAPEVLRAQYDVVTRQIPLMYAILIINLASLAVPHIGRAPLWLALGVPAFLCTIAVLRSIRLSLIASVERLSDDQVARRLRIVLILGFAIGIVLTSWSIALFSYGDAHTRSQVAFFAGVAIITVASATMPLRQVPVAILPPRSCRSAPSSSFRTSRSTAPSP
mgnify:FL=1|jgi:Predicted signal transduction protein containing a membrane domain, an EAL and a GGDEF domain